jgi:hypothetical protein
VRKRFWSFSSSLYLSFDSFNVLFGALCAKLWEFVSVCAQRLFVCISYLPGGCREKRSGGLKVRGAVIPYADDSGRWICMCSERKRERGRGPGS